MWKCQKNPWLVTEADLVPARLRFLRRNKLPLAVLVKCDDLGELVMLRVWNAMYARLVLMLVWMWWCGGISQLVMLGWSWCWSGCDDAGELVMLGVWNARLVLMLVMWWCGESTNDVHRRRGIRQRNNDPADECHHYLQQITDIYTKYVIISLR